MRQALENPFYYLDNFRQVLAWVGERHGDLLADHERAFLDRFNEVPQASQALLVRMVMRKGTLFRASKLRYAEIGCPLEASAALIDQGWIDADPTLDLVQLFALLNKDELIRVFGPMAGRSQRKTDLLQTLLAEHVQPRPFRNWCEALGEVAFGLNISELCDRLRLMFFGNIHQDWTEFVLADLGIFRYEQVSFSPASRAFHSRDDVDAYLHLHCCRERFEAGEALEEVLTDIPHLPYANEWLEHRRGKLLLSIGRQCERVGDLSQALRLHAANNYPGARERAVRVLERCDQPEAALQLASEANAAPESEHEAQQLQRILPRLRRALGEPVARRRVVVEAGRIDLAIARQSGLSVEHAVREHLSRSEAPVYYVENALINSLLGLLCWDAIFAPLPGAFFHPFHAAPADLARPDFYSRRAGMFDECLAKLGTDEYRDCIRRVFRSKFGIQSQFVSWGLLDEQLLEDALSCVSAEHLGLCFQRILRDVPSHRSGLPDLIQFWPGERRYRLIEVKGPGDRLQDNQKRWIDFALQHDIPIAVCYVQWTEGTP
ncbi:nuclease [Stutzerimonas stutzeri]|uniref:phosphodiesterase I n=1 Tax=Stutzerimonas stutzeri TaxID=316 RepID=W8QYD2_STUST|nr:VRR-NUC domain-containing protein [Stutzerimonas stutzeri]AHL75640.1 nuclease [Stutzerimonas stutzeri]MCQ4327781.1 VRR-NUC domain-containing protein [Stutzerimonas stutzeri]